MRTLPLFLAFALFALPLSAQHRLCATTQSAEYADAQVVLLHEPSDEFFLGVIHPHAALFEDYMDIAKIRAEHRAYRDQLENAGIKTHTVRELLLDKTRNQQGDLIEGSALRGLRELANRFLTFDASALDALTATDQKEYRSYVINSATPEGLVQIIMLQPKVILSPTETNTKMTATYLLNPIMNLFYTRDQMITTAVGTIIGRMNSPQREKECDVVEFCLTKVGEPALYRVSGQGAYLEGGDFYPFDNVAFIGCGMRTTQPAIDQLMERDLLGCDTLVVVKDRLFSQAQMHLDTYFNIIDRNLFTLSVDRMTSDADSPNVLYADIYVRGKAKGYRKVKSDQLFYDFLVKDLNADIIPITKDDASRLANNFLTIGARKIMAVAGQSEALQAMFRDKEVEVVWLPLDNLKKGYGAAHCMTQVLWRK